MLQLWCCQPLPCSTSLLLPSMSHYHKLIGTTTRISNAVSDHGGPELFKWHCIHWGHYNLLLCCPVNTQFSKLIQMIGLHVENWRRASTDQASMRVQLQLVPSLPHLGSASLQEGAAVIRFDCLPVGGSRTSSGWQQRSSRLHKLQRHSLRALQNRHHLQHGSPLHRPFRALLQLAGKGAPP